VPENKRWEACETCKHLKDWSRGEQKGGRPEWDTSLPAEANQLVLVRDLKPDSARLHQLLRCARCGTYYLYWTEYEFLVGGSEDTQTLERLSDEAAEKLLAG